MDTKAPSGPLGLAASLALFGWEQAVPRTLPSTMVPSGSHLHFLAGPVGPG